jgi:hypothetical protein
VTVAPAIQMVGPFRVSDSRSVDGDSDNHGHEPYAFRAYLIIYYIFLMDIITVQYILSLYLTLRFERLLLASGLFIPISFLHLTNIYHDLARLRSLRTSVRV